MLDVNAKAPALNLKSNEGKTVKLSDYKDKFIVLYFYPKDDTPGCTTEACNFRDEFKQITKIGAVILGVSPDDVTKHQKFIAKYELPFPLLADTDRKVCQAYGVWVEKNMYGKKYMGVQRSTFIIKNGKILHIFPKVKPKEHSAEVVDVLKTLRG